MYRTIMNVHSRVIYKNPKARNYPNAKQLQKEQMKIFNNKKNEQKTPQKMAKKKKMNYCNRQKHEYISHS